MLETLKSLIKDASENLGHTALMLSVMLLGENSLKCPLALTGQLLCQENTDTCSRSMVGRWLAFLLGALKVLFLFIHFILYTQYCTL